MSYFLLLGAYALAHFATLQSKLIALAYSAVLVSFRAPYIFSNVAILTVKFVKKSVEAAYLP